MARLRRLARWGLYALCALAPAAYVFAGAPPPSRGDPRTTPRFRPTPGGFGANYFPDVTLTTHEGQRVRLYDDLLKGKTVVVNFMYARCEGVCPGTTANLRRVQELLGEAAGRDVFFYSFSLKPEEDTPAVLNTYAEAHGVKPGWLFLTGAPADLELVRRKFGFVDPDPAVDAEKGSHVGVVLYGDVDHQQWAACPCLSNPRLMLEQIVWFMPPDRRPALGLDPVAPARLSALPQAEP